jgi:hypothetical protein
MSDALWGRAYCVVLMISLLRVHAALFAGGAPASVCSMPVGL